MEMNEVWKDPEKIVTVNTWDGKDVQIKLKDLGKLLKQQKQEQIEAGVWKGDK